MTDNAALIERIVQLEAERDLLTAERDRLRALLPAPREAGDDTTEVAR